MLAEPTTQTVQLDGKQVKLPTYMLRDAKGNAVNCVKLRKVAFLLNGTPAQFHVDFRSGAIRLDARTPYSTPNGTEMTVPSSGKVQIQNSSRPVLTDGTIAPLECFLLTDQKGGGHNYFKLRDIGEVARFEVYWDGEKGQIVIRTGKGD